MHIAAYKQTTEVTLAGMRKLRDALAAKSNEFRSIVKTGRTHFMDATPLTLGQEFSGYVQQLDNGARAITNALGAVRELALGGTAVGTGLNAPAGYDVLVAKRSPTLRGIRSSPLPSNRGTRRARRHGRVVRSVEAGGSIANEDRQRYPHPEFRTRSGIGEIIIPDNEPGSSIMPGKVNPTQPEAMTMVCAQANIGNDVAVSFGGASGHFELNVFKPVIAANVLQSARLIGDACVSFTEKCAVGIMPNLPVIKQHMENSLMLVTALNPHIGYENAAKIAKKAHHENKTLREGGSRTRPVDVSTI